MTNRSTFLCCFLAGSLISGSVVSAALIDFESGSLASDTGDVVIKTDDGGGWVDGGFRVVWDIDFDDEAMEYLYSYSLSDLDGNTLTGPAAGHFILEVASSATAGDFSGFQVDGSTPEKVEGPATFGPHPSNPGFPPEEEIFGLKVGREPVEEPSTFSVRSTWSPMDGSFFVKGGNFSSAFNSGLDGTDGAWIRVPGNPKELPYAASPDPGTLALLGSGLFGIGLWRRRRTRSR